MKKFVVVTAFAAVALAAQSAAACDWNREASVQNPVAATASTPTSATKQTSQSAARVSTNGAPEQAVRGPADEPAPVVLITNNQ
jgi:hypothetical protein